MTLSLKGYRKLIACIFSVACASFLCYVDKLTGTEYVTLAGGIVAGFYALNRMAAKDQLNVTK